jgi:hypothetical protein
VTGTHGLIRGAKEHFLASRKVDDAEHLKPYKKLLVDITVSRSGLDKGLGFANDLFNALESAGHRVVIGASVSRRRRSRRRRTPGTIHTVTTASGRHTGRRLPTSTRSHSDWPSSR